MIGNVDETAREAAVLICITLREDDKEIET